jgi:hypothetical protein
VSDVCVAPRLKIRFKTKLKPKKTFFQKQKSLDLTLGWSERTASRARAKFSSAAQAKWSYRTRRRRTNVAIGSLGKTTLPFTIVPTIPFVHSRSHLFPSDDICSLPFTPFTQFTSVRIRSHLSTFVHLLSHPFTSAYIRSLL